MKATIVERPNTEADIVNCLSLRISENYKTVSSTVTAIGDSEWQKNADPGKWPANNHPFTVESSPIEIKAKGKKVKEWMIDQYGLTGELPIKENRTFEAGTDDITLIPMGAARLRISAFPVYNN